MAINKSEINHTLGTKLQKWIKVKSAKTKHYHREIETARAINRIINAVRREPKHFRNKSLDTINRILKRYLKHHDKWLVNLDKIGDEAIVNIENCINDWIKWVDKCYVTHEEEIESLRKAELMAEQDEINNILEEVVEDMVEEELVEETIEELIEEELVEEAIEEIVGDELIEEAHKHSNPYKDKKPIPKKVIVQKDFTEIFTETVSGIQKEKENK